VVRAGDLVSQLVGVLDQGRIDGASTPRSDYRLQPILAPAFSAQNLRPALPLAIASPARLRVASFNVLNYFTTIDHGPNVCGPARRLDCRGADSAAEFVRQRDKILSAIASLDAHVVGLIELENNPVASLADLVAGLNAIHGPGSWAFVDTGTIGSDAVKVGFVYRTTLVATHGAFAVLDDSVDRRAIATKNRPSLAQTFRERATGELVTVVVNHFKSKGSDCNVARTPGELADPDLQDGQGHCNRTRTSIARALRDWLARDPTASRDPDVLLIGDLNANANEDPVTTLVAAGFVDLIGAFAGPHHYSYVFGGEAGALDHLLASPTLRAQVSAARALPINADEPSLLGYDNEFNPPAYYTPTPWRSSDHDPEVADLAPCVDRTDLAALLETSRDHPSDVRRDLDGDGRTTIADARRLVLRFTHPGGAYCP
jgi:predicted extracellular nuclease